MYHNVSNKLIHKFEVPMAEAFYELEENISSAASSALTCTREKLLHKFDAMSQALYEIEDKMVLDHFPGVSASSASKSILLESGDLSCLEDGATLDPSDTHTTHNTTTIESSIDEYNCKHLYGLGFCMMPALCRPSEKSQAEKEKENEDKKERLNAWRIESKCIVLRFVEAATKGIDCTLCNSLDGASLVKIDVVLSMNENAEKLIVYLRNSSFKAATPASYRHHTLWLVPLKTADVYDFYKLRILLPELPILKLVEAEDRPRCLTIFHAGQPLTIIFNDKRTHQMTVHALQILAHVLNPPHRVAEKSVRAIEDQKWPPAPGPRRDRCFSL